MRVGVVVFALLLSGCAADDAELPTTAPGPGTAAGPYEASLHNLTFGDQALEGSQVFEGTFLPHENALVQSMTGIDLNGLHEHRLDLPVARPVFVRAEIAFEGDPTSMVVSLRVPASASYSFCACRTTDYSSQERHLLLAAGDEVVLEVRQFLPSQAPAADYEVTVTWSSPVAAMYSGIPVELELDASANVTLTALEGSLNPVFVYEPVGGLAARLDGSPEVTFQALEAGAYVFLHSGHGSLAALEVTTGRPPAWRMVPIVAVSEQRDVPALRPDEDFVWEDDVATAPLQVQACTASEGTNWDPYLRVDFPGGGSIDSEFSDAYPLGGGMCISTPMGDDRLYPGTYTTTYNNQGAGDTWVRTTFIHLAR